MSSQGLPESLILPVEYERLFSVFVSPFLWGLAGVQNGMKPSIREGRVSLEMGDEDVKMKAEP